MNNPKAKHKNNKGITLVALIITIIVLLILAVVAIGAIKNDGIIDYAKNAKSAYEAATEKENEALQNYLSHLNENRPGAGNSDDSDSEEDETDKEPSEPVQPPQEPEEITINVADLELEEGKSGKLTVTITPNNDNIEGITYVSNDQNIAQVDSEGNVTAIAEGTTIITVTYKNVSDTCEIKVNKKQPTIIEFTIGSKTYSAEEGMTWEEWINSKEYDSGNWSITAGGYIEDEDRGYSMDGQRSDNVIEANTTYHYSKR